MPPSKYPLKIKNGNIIMKKTKKAYRDKKTGKNIPIGTEIPN